MITVYDLDVYCRDLDVVNQYQNECNDKISEDDLQFDNIVTNKRNNNKMHGWLSLIAL